jgi:sodium-dependent phosphate cotransporter
MVDAQTPEPVSPSSKPKPWIERFEDGFLAQFPWPVRYLVNTLIILFLLWLFLVGLSLMGNAFKGLSGKGAAQLIGSVDNPVAGVAFGVLGTVLLQSSSTSTSVVVTMVAAGILSVHNAIPIIMGANIGTSVTASIVSHVHITDKEEFKRGFQGATVHGAFNYLTVLVLFPVEVTTGLLKRISSVCAEFVLNEMLGTGAKWTSPTKIVTSPVTSPIIKINKDLIKDIAQGCLPCKTTDDGLCRNDQPDGDIYTEATMACDSATITKVDGVRFCHDYEKVEIEGEEVKFHKCISKEEWEQTHMVDEKIVYKGYAAELGDVTGSTVVLLFSLFLLCFALYWIVRILHFLVLNSGRGSGENAEDNKFVRVTRKVLGMHPILSIIYGMVMTVSVQSSSIVTSTLTPLVALDIITVEQVLPLTLGANIGTTCTAFLASIVNGSGEAIQVSICHLLFNLIGILIWFPLKPMRAVPLAWARLMGEYVLEFPWFGAFYIGVSFVALPLALYGCSLLLNFGLFGLILNIVLSALVIGGTFAFMMHFKKVYCALTGYTSPPATDANPVGKQDIEAPVGKQDIETPNNENTAAMSI